MWGSAACVQQQQDGGVCINTHPSGITVGLQEKVSLGMCSVFCSGYVQVPTQGPVCLGSGKEAIFNLKHVTDDYQLWFLCLQAHALQHFVKVP